MAANPFINWPLLTPPALFLDSPQYPCAYPDLLVLLFVNMKGNTIMFIMVFIY